MKLRNNKRTRELVQRLDNLLVEEVPWPRVELLQHFVREDKEGNVWISHGDFDHAVYQLRHRKYVEGLWLHHNKRTDCYVLTRDPALKREARIFMLKKSEGLTESMLENMTSYVNSGDASPEQQQQWWPLIARFQNLKADVRAILDMEEAA